jgi:hypothetical protein
MRPLSRSNVEAKTAATHAFVFSDIVVFTSPVSPGQDTDKKWTLLDDIGIVRVLGVNETLKPSGESFIVWKFTGYSVFASHRFFDRPRPPSSGSR